MARLIGGVISIIGYILGLIAIVNIQLLQHVLAPQLIIGSIGLVVAFIFTATLQENPQAQRIASYMLIGLGALMSLPVIFMAFSGAEIIILQILTAVIGLVLMFVSLRMVPR
jgi:hypothetical protein